MDDLEKITHATLTAELKNMLIDVEVSGYKSIAQVHYMSSLRQKIRNLEFGTPENEQ
jgi:hypothetical protein